MKTVFDIYRTIKETKADTYFAGSYTSSGYVGEYKAFADERQLERLYVIKGGSSRGKQTVIDRCIRAAQDAGVSVEYYLESPDSIGCVVLGKRLSVISDTSYSGRILYPGAFSEVIDLTVFSRCDILEKKRKDIVELTSRKTESLASAYRYLRAVKVLEEEKAVCTSAVFMQEKASACIDRLIKKLGRPQQKNGAVSYVRTHTLNGKGAFAVDTFEKIAEKRYYVNDCYGCAAVFMRMLADKLSAEGFRIKVSRLPVPDIIEGIFIEDCAVSVTVGEDTAEAQFMNMARFVKKELPDGIRGRFRLSSKIQLSCIEEALDRLAEAEEYGSKLDGIYNEALDEKKLEAFAGELEEELEFRLMHK